MRSLMLLDVIGTSELQYSQFFVHVHALAIDDRWCISPPSSVDGQTYSMNVDRTFCAVHSGCWPAVEAMVRM